PSGSLPLKGYLRSISFYNNMLRLVGAFEVIILWKASEAISLPVSLRAHESFSSTSFIQTSG
ncbi:MAG: hypothetical protein ABIM46_04180, partial [candidate division WOR-3 bacterium]